MSALRLADAYPSPVPPLSAAPALKVGQLYRLTSSLPGGRGRTDAPVTVLTIDKAHAYVRVLDTEREIRVLCASLSDRCECDSGHPIARAIQVTHSGISCPTYLAVCEECYRAELYIQRQIDHKEVFMPAANGKGAHPALEQVAPPVHVAPPAAPGAAALRGLDPVAIGELLAAAIEQHHWTQREAGKHFGVGDQSRVSMYIRVTRVDEDLRELVRSRALSMQEALLRQSRRAAAPPAKGHHQEAEAQQAAEAEAARVAAVLDEDDARDLAHDLEEAEATVAAQAEKIVLHEDLIAKLRGQLATADGELRQAAARRGEDQATIEQLRTANEQLVQSRDALEIERDNLLGQAQQLPARREEPEYNNGNGSAARQALVQEVALLVRERETLDALLARGTQVIHVHSGGQVVIQCR